MEPEEKICVYCRKPIPADDVALIADGVTAHVGCAVDFQNAQQQDWLDSGDLYADEQP